MEVQLTDFENAAYVVFIVLVTRVVLAFDLALYVPLSKVDENMKRAQERDATRRNKFFFRKHVAPPANVAPSGMLQSETSLACPATIESSESDDSFEEMTMDEIFHGKSDYYPGLIPLVYAYLDYIDVDPETFTRVDKYLKLISDRARGQTITTATWMRSFVRSHPSYRMDSVISSDIAYDLLIACKDIGEGSIACPEVMGDVVIERVRPEDAYGHRLAGRLSTEERSELLKHLVQRADMERPAHVSRGLTRTNSPRSEPSSIRASESTEK